MATSVVPDLIDALVTTAEALTGDGNPLEGVLVLDGFGVTEDPGDFLMIGVDDPDSDDPAFSADVKQDWANATYTAVDEEGDIACAVLSWSGDTDQKTVRDRVYAITAAVENMLRANPSLDLPTLLWTKFGVSSQLTQNQDEQGALALLVFRIHFRARI